MKCQFHNVLKLLREEHNVTQDELAKYLNVSRSTIAGYESRNRQPDYEKLIALSHFFNVSVDYLLTGIDNSHVPTIIDEILPEKLESSLLMVFRTLSYDSKYKTLEYAKLLEAYESNKKSSKRTISK